MVVREAEAMIIHATMDDLVEFAYGGWDEAWAVWRRREAEALQDPSAQAHEGRVNYYVR
jgi:hypothetical protein